MSNILKGLTEGHEDHHLFPDYMQKILKKHEQSPEEKAMWAKKAADARANAPAPKPSKPKSDPYIDYSDDYTTWKQGQNEDVQIDELSNDTLAKYKTAAAADAKKADSEGDYKRGDKRFSGIVKATKKQFANDEQGVAEDEAPLKHHTARVSYHKEGDPHRRYEAIFKTTHNGGKEETEKRAKAAFAAKKKIVYDIVHEQGVAEVSSNTLKRYKKAAQIDIDTTDNAGLYTDSDIDRMGRRMRGIDRATSKINATKRKEQGVAEEKHSCPHCGGEMVSEELMNEKKDACYYKVKSRYKVWPSAYASGALVKCRKSGADSWGNGGKKNESSILEGINRVDESLHDWFNKEKWVRMDTKGNIKGPCAKEPGEGKPKCLPQAKAHSLGKKGRASAAARKRREDPNPERSGKAINVNTKKKTNEEALDEKWSQKYKDSINCSNPKGFSQKAHCQGKNK
jgi:hypothetical protein